MKTNSMLCLIFCCLSCSSWAHEMKDTDGLLNSNEARKKFGLKAGLNSSNIFNQSNTTYIASARIGGMIGALQRARWAVSGAATFVRLYLMPVQHHTLPAQVRLVPAW